MEEQKGRMNLGLYDHEIFVLLEQKEQLNVSLKKKKKDQPSNTHHCNLQKQLHLAERLSSAWSSQPW